MEVQESVEEETEEEEAEATSGIPISYTKDVKVILDIKGLWFKAKTVVQRVTASTQQKMTRGVTCLSMASKEDKERWFNNLRQNFYWPPEQERLVWERYNDIGKKRLKDNMYMTAKRKKAPQFMQGGPYKELMKERNTKEFKAKSV